MLNNVIGLVLCIFSLYEEIKKCNQKTNTRHRKTITEQEQESFKLQVFYYQTANIVLLMKHNDI